MLSRMNQALIPSTRSLPFTPGGRVGYHQRRMIKLPPTLDRLLRFGLVGLGIFAIALGLTALQHEVLGFSEELAFGITLVVVLVVGFLANRHLVFDASGGDVRHQSAHYAVASLVFRALQYLSFLVLHTWLGMAYPVAITIVPRAFCRDSPASAFSFSMKGSK